MKVRIAILIAFFIATSAFFIHADKKGTEKYMPTPLNLEVPKGWPKPYDIFANNPLTEEGFQLGRKLFYDGRLSKDGNFSCASCHQQFAAFATFDHDFSHGFNDQFTMRNAPALQNLAWVPLYHWDGGINHIEVQALSPLTAPNEMAENVDSILNKLRADAAYKKMFIKAFGNEVINSQKMLKALAQFVGTLVSANSKYDKVKRGEDSFNASELHGYEVFKAKCEHCHKEPLFTDNSFRNNGLSANDFLKDYGRMRITSEAEDSIKFRVPTLRNVGVTQPFMHDGRLYSLGQVVEYYRSGIQQSATLDSSLRKGIILTPKEKYDLVLFLGTLTDTSFLKDKRFSQP
ncbi:MAG: cytochrome-c peroxidase [Ginsengibacter sp.]